MCVTSGCVVCEEVTDRETAGASAAVLPVTSVLLAAVATSGAKAVGRELLNS